MKVSIDTFWVFCRLLSNSDFAADFHIYGLEWLPTGMNFYVDGEKIGSVTPPAGGFWELGGFQGQNIWQSGSFMAPFDRQVVTINKKLQ
jgi:beta-glucanase (GH16 family)